MEHASSAQESRWVITVEGATAVGKTAVSVLLAQQLGCSVLSSDSRQCYREMKIGTARPDEDELGGVPHYFLADRSVRDPWSAGQFEEEGLARLSLLHQSESVALLTGGSNLYTEALLRGMDSFPDVSEEARTEVANIEKKEGLEGLVRRLKSLDPDYAKTADLSNPRRLSRAIEVCISSGQAYSSFRSGLRRPRPFQVLRFILERDREELYERINSRVLTMISSGLEEEARALLPQRELSPLDTVGYRELFGYFDGLYDRGEAVRLIMRNTRRYAKRQLTWLKGIQDATRIQIAPGSSGADAADEILSLTRQARKKTKT